jgi:tetratricopeptide (TPR) repeat protein
MKLLLILSLLVSCSSKNKVTKTPETVTNDSFKKEKPLSNTQVPDYYKDMAKTMSPALQDETMDRLNESEISKLSSPTDPLLDLSLKCLRGDFKSAFSTAAVHFHRYQKVAAYWNQVANCHLNAGSYRKALLFYNKALEVKPNYVPALNNIGVMYSRQGQDQKALIAFEKANKESKFSKTPRYNLARLYLVYGLVDLALPLFQGLLSESSGDVDLLNAVATSYVLKGDYDKAKNYYQNVPKSEWPRAEVGLNFALTLNKLGQSAEAQKVFSMVTTPKNSGLKRYYTFVKSQLGVSE